MTGGQTLHVLFVCTANVCRSPLAAGLMAHHARDSGAKIRVASASIDQETRAMHPTTLKLLADRGISLDRTESQPLTAGLIDGADLVLTMTRDHANAVVGRFPTAREWTFVLGHFTALISELDRHETVGAWLRAAYEASAFGRLDDQWDIVDPNGRSNRVYQQVDAELDFATAWLASELTSITS
ncbi:MAG: hypothetical protein AAGC53_15835, partial [Actinomycetota bacterium]